MLANHQNEVLKVEPLGTEMVVTATNGDTITLPMPEDVERKFAKGVKCLCGVVVKEGEDFQLYVGTASFHNHSSYSLLDGANKIETWAKHLKENRKTHPQICALTDHGNMFGTYKFSTNFEKAKLVPIIGCEVYTESINGKMDANHLVLLCKNEQGYHNLVKIVSAAEENFYNRPQVKWENLRKYSDGLVCLSACLGGEIAKRVAEDDVNSALEVAENFIDIFGEDFYIEVQNHNILLETQVFTKLREIAKMLDVKTVCTSDSHYLLKESSKAHEILLCIGTKRTMDDEKRFKFDGDGYHILSDEEVFERFDVESIENQVEVAMKCQFRFKQQEVTMPNFDTQGKDIKELFIEECWKGFEFRFNNKDIDVAAYKERLQYEIDIISKMNYEAYFLIVSDFIKYAKSKDIAVGPGRGSAVGSLAAFALEITDLDPIPYGLLFERFLNPERISMPDIDIDFQDNRRDEVIDYVKEKYGEECVSRIVTFGTLAARMCVRDVGRAMNAPLSLVDSVAKAIPAVPKMTIKKAMDESSDFKKAYSNPEVKELVDIAMQLEGLTRHKSQHACGIVISAKPTSEYVPEVLLEDKHGNVARTAGFTMGELEELGLLKMDFLGLRNMYIIKEGTKALNIESGDIPLDDPYVYELLSTGNTDGIFQVESGGMKALMRDMFSDIPSKIRKIEKRFSCKGYGKKTKGNPANFEAYLKEMSSLGKEGFERLIAAISLYRPGPMESIPQYVEGMKNPSKIHYDTPELKNILDKTYGVIVYQEQVQQIVRELAGYSLGRGDIIRRAMGKKKQEMMDKEKDIFLYGNEKAFKSGKDDKLVEGCKAKGIDTAAAQIIWDKMEKFAAYAFNKSHAAGYAVISIQTAWLKKYCPTIFWTATLNSVISKAQSLKKYIASAKNDGVKVLPPNIQKSEALFTNEENNEIRMGLVSLRNLGKSCLPIIKEREQNGAFESFENFFNRCVPDKRALESLILSGALDVFGGTRRGKRMLVEDEVLSNIKTTKREHSKQHFTIPELDEWFETFFTINEVDVPEMDERDMLEHEYIYTGMYVTKHPLEQYLDILVFPRKDISELVEDEDDESDTIQEISERVTVIGVIKEVEVKNTRKGTSMRVFKLEDLTGSIRVTAFSEAVESFGDIILNNNLVKIDGVWKVDDFGSQIIVNSVQDITKLEAPKIQNIKVTANKNNLNDVLQYIDEVQSSNGSLVVLSISGKDFYVDINATAERRAIPVGDASDKSKLVRVPFRTTKNLRNIATKVETVC